MTLTYVLHNGLGHPVHHLSTFLWWSCQQQWGNEREDRTLRTILNVAWPRVKFLSSNFPITESSENLLATVLLLLGLLIFMDSAVKAALLVRKQSWF